MGFGLYRINKDSKLYTEQPVQKSQLGRTLFLGILMFSFVLGLYINSKINVPSKTIDRVIKKSQSKFFMASLEGYVSMKDSLEKKFRTRETYIPEKGITVSKAYVTADSSPVNALDALKNLSSIKNVRELKKEDMYGAATRHFTGDIQNVSDGKTSSIFELWINMYTIMPVRLSIIEIERNAAQDSIGEPVSRITSYNIRYHNWNIK